MSEDNKETEKENNPDNQENQEADKEDNSDIDKASKNAQDWVEKSLIPIIKPLAKFGFGFGSGAAFFTFLSQEKWLMALLTFPVTIATVIWARYSDAVITRFGEIYAERGKQDVDSLMTWVDKVDKTVKETIKWQLAGVEDKYLKLQGNTCKDFTTEGYKPSNIFLPLLNEVYVPLDLSNNFYRNFQGESLPLPQGLKWDEKTIELIEEEGLKIWDVLTQANKFPAFKRLAVIAWGGFGKTTLLRHITYILTQQKRIYRDIQNREKQSPELLPVLILLRNYQEIIIKENNLEESQTNNQKNLLTLPALIEKYHIPNLPENEGFELPPNWAKNHLKNGKMLVMFDGFDEVKEDYQKEISRWLGEEMNNYQNSIFILTSRPSGYKHFLTEYKLKSELFVKPLNRRQQSKFIHNWYWCQEKYIRGGRDTPDVKAEAENNSYDLLAQLEKRPELDALAKIPLLLNIITTLHRSYSGAELPKRRTDLYREVVNLQLGNRPLARQIQLLLPPEEAQKVLQILALYMVKNNKPIIEYDYLLNLLDNPVKSFNNSVDTNKFIKQIIDVSELLVKRDEHYQFAHLSFQGYLASKEIIETKQDNLLIDNWDKSWWRETILLYSAQVNPNNLLRKLIEIRSDEALKLAKLCINETPRQIDEDVTKNLSESEIKEAEKEFENIESQVDNLLFAKLEKYLKNGQWREADEETSRLMLQLGDKDEKGYLNEEDCKNFPKEELRTIDKLWLDNSDGKFGFSVQKQIYLEGGGKLDHYDLDSFKKMSDRIGWYDKYKDKWLNITYNDNNAPQGHLPSYKRYRMGWGFGRVMEVYYLFSLL